MSYDDWRSRAPEDDAWQPTRGIERECAQCHRSFFMSRSEDYVIAPVCDDCQRDVWASQAEARLRAQQKGAA